MLADRLVRSVCYCLYRHPTSVVTPLTGFRTLSGVCCDTNHLGYLYIFYSLIFFLSLTSFANAEVSWETLSRPHFFIHYPTSEARLAQTLAAQADRIYQAVTADVGYFPPQKIFVYLCPTRECFRQKQPGDEKLPDWAVGVAYPALRRIVIRSALTFQEKGTIQPVEIFEHELAHIVLEQALAQQGGAPRWLSEGFSMYAAREWTLAGQRTIAEVTLRQTFIPLLTLMTSFPADEEAARIAYAESFSLVAFILNHYGKASFHQLIANLRAGMDANAALVYATGVNLARLESEWQADLQKRHSWFAYLADIGIFWFLLSVGFLLIYLLKRRQTKRLEAQWAQEEQTESQEADAPPRDDF